MPLYLTHFFLAKASPGPQTPDNTFVRFDSRAQRHNGPAKSQIESKSIRNQFFIHPSPKKFRIPIPGIRAVTPIEHVIHWHYTFYNFAKSGVWRLTKRVLNQLTDVFILPSVYPPQRKNLSQSTIGI